MKKNRGANIIYATHSGKGHEQYSQIAVHSNGELSFLIMPTGGFIRAFELDRRHARLLAKRILQALEDTK